MGRRIPWWRRWSAREASGPVEQRAALDFLEWHRGDPTVERLKSSGKGKVSQKPARKPSSFFPFSSSWPPLHSSLLPCPDEVFTFLAPTRHTLRSLTLWFLAAQPSAAPTYSRQRVAPPLPRSGHCGLVSSLRRLGWRPAAYCSSPLSRLRISLSHRQALVGSATGKRMVGLSEGEKRFIRGGIAQDLRTDGRQRLHYRPISIETGVIPQANGSARVRLGATDVIVSIKAELRKPHPLQPDKGKVAIFIDCSPTAAPMFEGRGGEELSTELSFALQRCLLGGRSGAGAGIDLSSLVIVEGKVCWDLYIDGLVVSSDGNLLDALAAAIKVALSNTGIPKVTVNLGASPNDQPDVDVSDEEFLQFDTSGVPVIVTLTKVSRHYIVDATSEEESQMSSAVSISVNRHGHICGLTKRGGAGLDPSVILDMISVAKHVGEQLMSLLDSEIAAAEASAEDQ
ncbi:unnamed protein product [Musa hybrid cultivar]